MDMKNAMIMVPTAGKTYDAVIAARENAVKELSKDGKTYAYRDNLLLETRFPPDVLDQMGITSRDMFWLSKILEMMAACEVAYFCEGWQKETICKLANDMAHALGIEHIIE